MRDTHALTAPLCDAAQAARSAVEAIERAAEHYRASGRTDPARAEKSTITGGRGISSYLLDAPGAIRRVLLWAWMATREGSQSARTPGNQRELRRHRAVLYGLLVQAELAEPALSPHVREERP